MILNLNLVLLVAASVVLTTVGADVYILTRPAPLQDRLELAGVLTAIVVPFVGSLVAILTATRARADANAARSQAESHQEVLDDTQSRIDDLEALNRRRTVPRTSQSPQENR